MDASMVSAKKSNKCAHPSGTCTDRIVKIVGDCKFCKKSFCSRHRQVETHECANLESCRQQHFQNNSNKLMNGKVSGMKI